MIKVCKNCKKEFNTNDHNYKHNLEFDSIKCYREYNKGKNHPSHKGDKLNKICKCGKIFRETNGRDRKYCSHKCQGIYNQKENHPNWKGGPKDYLEERHSATYKRFMLDFLISSGGRCENCGYTHGIQVHHIIQVKDAPEYMYLKENLVCLCRDCHKPLHSKNKKKALALFNIQFEDKIFALNVATTR